MGLGTRIATHIIVPRIGQLYYVKSLIIYVRTRRKYFDFSFDILNFPQRMKTYIFQ